MTRRQKQDPFENLGTKLTKMVEFYRVFVGFITIKLFAPMIYY